MSLPPFDSGVSWEEYAILTPTFRLSPVEKPDMSPFLLHMTGRNAILSILQGQGRSEQVEAGWGFLRSGIPESSKGHFEAKVVCFTESPTFAVDFFRYRKRARWEGDQLYGIGFDKTALVDRGVRPAVYADRATLKSVQALIRVLRGADDDTKNTPLFEQSRRLLLLLYPLLFPLLEDNRFQGFTWEREWRHPSRDGLVFPHSEIRVICCPIEEEGAIHAVLGDTADKVDFVRTWVQYDEITEFINDRRRVWARREAAIPAAQKPAEQIDVAKELLREYTAALHSLETHETRLEQLRDGLEGAENFRVELQAKLSDLAAKIAALEGVQVGEEQEQPNLVEEYERLRPLIDEEIRRGVAYGVCRRCGAGAMREMERLETPLTEARCSVCQEQTKALRIECQQCQTPALVGQGCSGVCPACRTEVDEPRIVEYVRTTANDGAPPDDENASCNTCGRSTVIPTRDGWLCVNCFARHGEPQRCHWCDSLTTGDVEDSYTVGCLDCGGFMENG